MRAIIATLFATLLLGGCLINSHGSSRGRATARSRDCPPAHHWEGGVCVHNGKAKGHYKR